MTVTATGYASCHHGEILQGTFLDTHGRPQLGLVSLPMPEPATRADYTRRPHARADEIRVVPGDRCKARSAARLTTEVCAAITAQPQCGGELRLRGKVPVGLGMGSSTSDVLATIRAVSASFGISMRSCMVARLAVRVERACDPLMFGSRPALFAQRQGHVLEVLGDALPPVAVLGCLTGQGQPVETTSVPTGEYGDTDLRLFEHLRGMLREAIAHADAGLLGRVATASARHHQRLLPKPELETLTTIAETVGAAGVQVAHSGNVAGLLFDLRDPGLDRRLRRGTQLLDTNGLPTTEPFTTRSGKETRGRAHHRHLRSPRSGAPRQRADLPAL